MKRSPMPARRKAIGRGRPLARTGRLRPVSAKGAAERRDRRQLRAALVDLFGEGCQLATPVCTGRQQGLHHVVKASQGGPTSATNCLLSCNPCNGWVEDNPEWARALGLVKRSWEDR